MLENVAGRVQKEPSRRNHRPREKEASAGERDVLCCLVEKMKVYDFAHYVIRLMCVAGLGVFFRKIFASMRLLLVSRVIATIIEVRQIQTCAANRRPAEVVLASGLLDV